jgi:hypothetical protein
MVKHAQGYNVATKDWEFIELDGFLWIGPEDQDI